MYFSDRGASGSLLLFPPCDVIMKYNITNKLTNKPV